MCSYRRVKGSHRSSPDRGKGPFREWGPSREYALDVEKIKYYEKYKIESLKRLKEFTLSINEFYDIKSNNCKYCNDKPIEHHGIDRIDNNLGYVKGNVTSCCSYCNMYKNTMSVEEFISIIKNSNISDLMSIYIDSIQSKYFKSVCYNDFAHWYCNLYSNIKLCDIKEKVPRNKKWWKTNDDV